MSTLPDYPTIILCDMCGEPFATWEEYEERHTVGDYNYHEDCCPLCASWHADMVDAMRGEEPVACERSE